MPDPREWHRILSPDDLGDVVKVQVSYYSELHQRKIKASLPGHVNHLPIDGTILRIPAVEFLAYWLFEDKDPDDPLSASFEVLSQSVQDALPDLKRNFEHSNSDVRARRKIKGSERPGDISTRLGVAVGLAVGNYLLGRTRADWMKRSKTYRKGKKGKKGKEERRLDYALTTTDDGYVVLENKGTIVPDNQLKSSGVSRHLDSIRKKKRAARRNDKSQVLLAAIAAADNRDDSTLKCWLLDPPVKLPIEHDPELFRIVARLRYQAHLLRCVFPAWRSLHWAIQERVKSLTKLNNWQGYSGMPLRSLMNIPIRAKWEAKLKPQTMSANGLWVGAVHPCGTDHLLFIGVSKDWVSLILRQDLAALLEVKSQAVTEKVFFQWEATDKEIKWLTGTGANVRPMESKRRHKVDLPAVLHQSSSGFAFALIPTSGS